MIASIAKRSKVESSLHHEYDDDSNVSFLGETPTKEEILNELKTAFSNLQELGINLSKTTKTTTIIDTTIESKEDESLSNSSSSDSDLEDEEGFLESLLLSSSNNSNQQKKKKSSMVKREKNEYNIHRVSDQQVLYDIFYSIRSCIRVSIHTNIDSNSNDGLPFVPPTMIPCTRLSKHPSCKAYHILSHAFQTLHMYCIGPDDDLRNHRHKNNKYNTSTYILGFSV